MSMCIRACVRVRARVCTLCHDVLTWFETLLSVYTRSVEFIVQGSRSGVLLLHLATGHSFGVLRWPRFAAWVSGPMSRLVSWSRRPVLGCDASDWKHSEWPERNQWRGWNDALWKVPGWDVADWKEWRPRPVHAAVVDEPVAQSTVLFIAERKRPRGDVNGAGEFATGGRVGCLVTEGGWPCELRDVLLSYADYQTFAAVCCLSRAWRLDYLQMFTCVHFLGSFLDSFLTYPLHAERLCKSLDVTPSAKRVERVTSRHSRDSLPRDKDCFQGMVLIQSCLQSLRRRDRWLTPRRVLTELIRCQDVRLACEHSLFEAARIRLRISDECLDYDAQDLIPLLLRSWRYRFLYGTAAGRVCIGDVMEVLLFPLTVPEPLLRLFRACRRTGLGPGAGAEWLREFEDDIRTIRG